MRRESGIDIGRMVTTCVTSRYIFNTDERTKRDAPRGRDCALSIDDNLRIRDKRTEVVR